MLFRTFSYSKSFVFSKRWGDLEAALKGLKQTIASYANTDAYKKWQNAAIERVGAKHADIQTLDLFPFPIVIIGGYYDKFQDFGKCEL